MDLQPYYISSTGKGLSLTIKDLLLSVVPLVIIVARLKGLELTEGDFMPIVDTIIGVVENVTTAAAGVMVLYGLGRKAYSRLFP
jgi:hypothetical protein